MAKYEVDLPHISEPPPSHTGNDSDINNAIMDTIELKIKADVTP